MSKAGKSVDTIKQFICVAGEPPKQLTHPAMLTYVVLQNLFKYGSSFKEIQRNRLVCQAWFKASAPLWNKLTKTIILYRDFNTLNKIHPERSENPLDNADTHMTLEQLWQTCLHTSNDSKEEISRNQLEKKILTRKFVLRNWKFDKNVMDLIKYPTDSATCVPPHERFFWSQVAPSLVLDLCLDSCRFPQGFIPFSKVFLKTFPKLKRLQLQNCNIRRFFETMELEGRQRQLLYQISQQDAFAHLNLQTLEITSTSQAPLVSPTVKFLKMLPNVKHLKLHGINHRDEKKLNVFLNSGLIRCALEEIDFLDFSLKAQRVGAFAVTGPGSAFESLKVLHVDIGFETGYLENLRVSLSNLTSLEELHLYTGIFSPPWLISHLFTLWHTPLPSVTELYIWGNLTENLLFLQIFPNLKKLVWNTSCFDPKHFGKRTYSLLEQGNVKAFPLMNKDLTENPTGSQQSKGQAVYRLLPLFASLEHLEIDWSVKSYPSWSILKNCMPNLVHLKVKILGERDLEMIKSFWKNLQTLEFAHGSRLSPQELFNGLNAFSMTQLRVVRIPKCTCICNLRSKNVKSVLNLIKKIGEKIGVAISLYEVYAAAKMDVVENVCLHSEYNLMLETGNVQHYLDLLKVNT